EYNMIINSKKQANQINYIKRNIPESFQPLQCDKKQLQLGKDFIVNSTLTYENIECSFGLLVKVKSKSLLGEFSYEPAIFSGSYTVSKERKIELAFIGYILGCLQGKYPKKGKIICIGDNATNIELAGIIKNISTILNSVQKWFTNPTQEPPRIILNKNCSLCQFNSLCKPQAEKDDNLSLLDGISTAKTINKYEKKGIFTLKQLSYLYKPRRNKKTVNSIISIHNLELQALAIRSSKIFVHDLPRIQRKNIEIFLDIEGIPDQKHYYLFGLLICKDNVKTNYSFWSNDLDNESVIWQKFIDLVNMYDDCSIYHYGSYERIAIVKLGKKYSIEIDSIIKRLVNVNNFIYGKVYFPVRSNSLKDICTYLGYTWEFKTASGLQSLVWRHYWEFSNDDKYKQILINYNLDDCKALQMLVDELSIIGNSAETLSDIDFTNQPKKTATLNGGIVHNQFEIILKLAHFDYNNKKISLKQNENIQENGVVCKNRVGGQKGHKGCTRKASKANKIIYVDSDLEIKCPKHNDIILKNTNQVSEKTLIDLVFTKNGIKKTTIKYVYTKKYCSICGRNYSFNNKSYNTFGNSFQSWVVYQRLFLRLPYNVIQKVVEDQFREEISQGTIINFIRKFSDYYANAEKNLVESMLKSPFIHADETKINIQGVDHYVWVFTDGKQVVFKLTKTRESNIVNEFLLKYNGILVSDFYPGYSSASYKQQKCWVHLIRDINDDMWKSPFDTEFETFVTEIRNLIIPIFMVIEKYGLKKRHFNKFEKKIDAFYAKSINKREYKSELCLKYQKRFDNFKGSLFTFLKYDSIPWNNNTAERAIRHLAVQRKISGYFYESLTPQYLLLLGMMQTCKFQNKSFLKFLLSGETDINNFKNKNSDQPIHNDI
ncbi:MAG TPA: TM0106 family RecB-like putative nuclease, partial [Candidatus Paceibacterota bacterium]